MRTTAELRKIIKGYPSSEISRVIDEYIHDARDRAIARRKIIDNERIEPLAETYNLTPRHVNRIIKQAREVIASHLE